MSHLIQITPTGEIETLDYDGTAPSLPQLLQALSANDITVEILDAPAHNRGEHITVWADDEGLTNDGRLNFLASAYAGSALIGTVVISGFNAETGDTVGLTADQAAEVRHQITQTADLVDERLEVLARLAQL